MIPLSIQDLNVDYGSAGQGKRAVDHFNLEMKPGEILGLLGPNGAGKTSVISAVTALLQKFQGSIKVFGHPSGSPDAKVSVGLVPQEMISYGFFNVQEILDFNAGFFGVQKPKARIEMLLKRLQLWDARHKKVAQLSGGMKRRLSIAKALVHSPKLLLLDEPSAGVDVELRDILWEFVRELNSQGTSILLTTHYLEEAEELCNRVAVINRGKLIALDTTQSLLKNTEEETLENAYRKMIRADGELSA